MTPKDILTNPCFCPMPWTGLMYNFDGKVKNCIRSNKDMPIGNLSNSTIQEIVSGEENLKRQQQIINRESVPSCQPCYDLERNKKRFDIVSDRIFYIREFKHLSPDTYTHNNFDLQTIDVRWSNLCNFSCVYCGPEFSSKWAAEIGAIQSTPSAQQTENFKQYIYDHATNLKHVYLAGGEPLLMKENLDLLAKLNPDVQLRINTNLSKVDTLVFQEICKFKNVHWIVSAETVDQEYEYIRYGGNWQDFLENLKIIKDLDHRITFNMLHFLLNYNTMFDFVDYFTQLGFHNNSFVIGPLLAPTHFNLMNLPDIALNGVKAKLEDRINQQPGYLLEDSYRNILHYMQQPFDRDLTKSFDQLHKLDQRRGIDSSKIFKDLYNFKEEKSWENHLT